MSEDDKYTDYLNALGKLEACPAGRYMVGLSQRISTDFFKCRCGAAETRALGELEAFCTVKDYKVVEGLRKKDIPCECTPGAFARRFAAAERVPMVVLPQSEAQPDEKKYSRREEREYGGVKYYCYFYGEDDWLHRKIEEAKNNPVKDFIAEWTNPDPLSFGSMQPLPEFPSFLDIAKNGVRMADRPKAIPGRRGMSFFQHPCDALEGLLPVFGESGLATITAADTGVTQRLDEALEEVRHKGESFPSPYLTHVYTVNPDE